MGLALAGMARRAMSEPSDRRQFLARMWKWSLGLFTIAGVWTSWDILRPGTPVGFGGKVRTVPPDQVPDPGVLTVPAAQSYLTVIDGEVVALWWKCPHLGCRVPWCESSEEYECPCHGSNFNRVGDVLSGPAPRGLDRFELEVSDDMVVIDTGAVILGEPAGEGTLEEESSGPPCDEGTE